MPNIELIPCCGDRNLFLRLAKEYVEELAQYDAEIVWDEATWRDYMWESVFIVEDRQIQGFICATIERFNIFPDALYIGEFFIVPEARQKGIGTEAVKKLIEMFEWSGDIFLYILHGNFAARAFWLSIEHEYDWKRINRPEIKEANNCELRVYQQGYLL